MGYVGTKVSKVLAAPISKVEYTWSVDTFLTFTAVDPFSGETKPVNLVL